MKLTVNLNDPTERQNCKAILSLWDDTDETKVPTEPEEYTYLPEDEPAEPADEPAEPAEVKAEAEPAAVEAPADEPVEVVEEKKAPAGRPKAKVPPSRSVSLEEAQTLAKRLAREKGYNSDKIRPLFTKYNDAAKISDLSEEDRGKFAAEVLEILGEADV